MSTKHGDETKTNTVPTGSGLAKPNLKGDWMNVMLLLLLYTLQGLPLGISSCVPLFLQSKKTSSFQEQALFSLASYPFSLKLLWAPMVDALFMRKLGRRKSWLIPIQYLIGAILLYLADEFDNLLPETGKPNIKVLVCIFMSLNFLAATQDIAVDGWCLTMLKKNNVGYASTCNSLGQALGVLIGNMIPILLTSEEFCNKHLRTVPETGGVLTMKSFFYACGVIFILVTTLVGIFKKENDCTLDDDHVKLTVFQNYLLLWDIFKIPDIRLFSLVLITAKIGFAATDSASTLKLIDAGLSKDDITIVDSALSVVKLIMPIALAKYTSGPKPMSVYLKIIPHRLILGILFATFIYYTPELIHSDGIVSIPAYYYGLLALIIGMHNMMSYTMFVAALSFFSRISDSRFGGTYMTLLNTVMNLGSTMSSTFAFGLIDLLTFKSCSPSDCEDSAFVDDYKKTDEDSCSITVDGFYIEVALCTIFGIIWYTIFKKIIKKFQKKGPENWLVNVKNSVKENDENSYSMTVNS